MSERERLEALIERALEDLEELELEAIRAELRAEPSALSEFEALLEMRTALRTHLLDAQAPPASLDEPILVAARSAARGRRMDGAAKVEGPLLHRLPRWLAHALRGPQVAMATVSLLVVALSLFFVPLREQAARDGGDTALTQATRELPNERTPRELPEGAALMNDASKRADQPRASDTSGSAGASRERAATERPRAERPASKRTERQAATESAEKRATPRLAEDEAQKEPAPRAVYSAESQSAGRTRLAPAEDSQIATPRAAPMADESIPQPAQEQKRAVIDEARDEHASRNERAIDAMRTHLARREYASAAELGRALLGARTGRSAEIAEILSLQARAERGLARCDRAVPIYERLIREYPEQAAAEGAAEKIETCKTETR